MGTKNPYTECRLDYFFIPENQLRNVTNSTIDHLNIMSDHKPIHLELNLTKHKREPGYWKINNSLLKDEIFCSEINDLIDKSWNENRTVEDVHVRYELLKYNLQQYIRKYSAKNHNIEKIR